MAIPTPAAAGSTAVVVPWFFLACAVFAISTFVFFHTAVVVTQILSSVLVNQFGFTIAMHG
jgi:hypothetical protein